MKINVYCLNPRQDNSKNFMHVMICYYIKSIMIIFIAHRKRLEFHNNYE